MSTPPAAGAIQRLLTAGHDRLDALLAHALATPDRVDADAYAAFRKGLLRHIAMEEKILLPAAQRARGGDPLPLAARLRADHGALTALLVPSPTSAIGNAIRTILADHNAREEGPDGVYATCERLAGSETASLLTALVAVPEVSVKPHVDGPFVVDSMRRALSRAGYDPAALGV